MSNPDNFIVNSDFATLKNDATGTATLTIPHSFVIAGNDAYIVSTDINIGEPGAITAGRIYSDKYTRWLRGQSAVYTRTGLTAEGISQYNIAALIYRASPTVVRCTVIVPNPYSIPITTEGNAETINFYVSTFKPPFV